LAWSILGRERLLLLEVGDRPDALAGDRHGPVTVDAGHLGPAPDGAVALVPVGEPAEVDADQRDPECAVVGDRGGAADVDLRLEARAQPDRPAGHGHHLALAADPVPVADDRLRRRDGAGRRRRCERRLGARRPR
jgi:hypothetical protein